MAYHEHGVVLRLSGGALGNAYEVFDKRLVEQITEELARVVGRTGLVVVVGGGNIARGRDLSERFGLDPESADDIGMLATSTNACLLNRLLLVKKIPSVVVSARSIGFSTYHLADIKRFWKSHIVFVADGTGKGGVTTDTSAIRLAQDLRASIILKGTNVDGIYSADPALDQKVEFFPELNCGEFKRRGLSQILDPSAVEEMTIPIRVFDILTPGLLLEAIAGRPVGSLLTPTLALLV